MKFLARPQGRTNASFMDLIRLIVSLGVYIILGLVSLLTKI